MTDEYDAHFALWTVDARKSRAIALACEADEVRLLKHRLEVLRQQASKARTTLNRLKQKGPFSPHRWPNMSFLGKILLLRAAQGTRS